MNTVIIFSLVYNAEKTLRRAINSVLNQTYGEFIYYICDNASTDKTWEILQEYAMHDIRIRPLRNEINSILTGVRGWDTVSFVTHWVKEHSEEQNANNYFCNLDGDDEYKPDFLEKMLAFMEENNLDVAACGHDFIDAQTNRLRGVRKLNSNMILEKSGFGEHFPIYHQFMRTIWCKMYRFSLLEQCDYDNYKIMYKITYGPDTLFCMKAFSLAKRAGIFAESLHKYYISNESFSYNYNNKRGFSDRIQHDETTKFLIDKVGSVSPENMDHLFVVYFYAIEDTLLVLLNVQITFVEKCAGLHDILTNNLTQRLISWQGYKEEKNQLFQRITDWLLAQKETQKPANTKIIVEILLAMHNGMSTLVTSESLEYLLLIIPDIVKPILKKDYHQIIGRLQSWYKRHNKDDITLAELEISAYRALNKTDDEHFSLLADIRRNCPKASEKLDIDKQISDLLAKNPLLDKLSAGLACAFPRTVRRIFQKDFTRALDDFISVSQNVETADSDIEAYILLGQNLSAAAGNPDAYVYFKKMWISYLLDCLRIDEADKELVEFEQLLPNDADFKELRIKIGIHGN